MMAEKIVDCAGCAAFSRAPNGRITAWNEPAETLLARPANFAVNRKCYHVLAGRDRIGNYCSERCPTWRLALEQHPIKPYTLSVKAAQGRRKDVEFVILVSDEDDGLHLIHLMIPVNQADPVFPEHEDDSAFDAIRLPFELGHHDLTPFEVDVMHQLSIGRDCSEIAQRRNENEDKVWNEFSSLVQKLDCHNPPV